MARDFYRFIKYEHNLQKHQVSQNHRSQLNRKYKKCHIDVRLVYVFVQNDQENSCAKTIKILCYIYDGGNFKDQFVVLQNELE